MKKIVSLIMSIALVFSLTACGGNPSNSPIQSSAPSPSSPTSPPDLTGEWKQSNSGSDNSWQGAIIKGDAIEIYWVSDNGDTTALYWAGTYVAPDTANEPYSWDSNNDKEKTDSALLASGDDTKTFTYENGEISYSASAFGETMTVKLEQENWVKAQNTEQPIGENGFDEQKILSQLEVNELQYSSDFWNYAFLTIKNNSEFNLSISANVKFYDDAGNLVGAKSGEQEAIENGFDTILYFMPDEKFAKMEYELSVSEEDYYDCVLSDLSYEGTIAKNKVILSVKNNGTEPAKFVEASVLFFSGEKLVGFSQNYITDDDSELKPGKTIDKEMDCYEEFDSYQVFFSGRR